MGELGFYGPSLPEEYGCAGLSSVAYGLLMYELEPGYSGLRSFASVQGSLVMWPIYAYGSEAQKQHWLPKMAKGEKIGCFGLTEPDFGSNPGGMLTKAVREPGGKWRINGTKMWITNGTIADVAVVWAQTEDGIRGFLVEKGTPGFSAPEMKGKWSLRASTTSELVLEDVIVEEEKSLLPHVKGLKGPLGCLTQARFGIAWGALGAADACYQCALDYAKHRISSTSPSRASNCNGKAGLDGDGTIKTGSGASWAASRTPRPTPGAGQHGQDEQRERRWKSAARPTILGANGIWMNIPSCAIWRT